MTRLLLVCLLAVLAACRASRISELEIFPKHFVLQPGEQIHYTVMERSGGRQPRSADAQFTTENSEIVRPITPTGLFEAIKPGRRADDGRAYDQVVVPFLNRMIREFPLLGYPADAPTPALRELMHDWNIVVRVGERFERVYRQGDSNKTLLVEFQGV